MNIDNVYKLLEKLDKAKQQESSLKGRRQEIQKRCKKEWGASNIGELKEVQMNLCKGLKKEETEIEDMYNELKEDFE